MSSAPNDNIDYYNGILLQISTNLSNTLQTFGSSSHQYQIVLQTLKDCLAEIGSFQCPNPIDVVGLALTGTGATSSKIDSGTKAGDPSGADRKVATRCGGGVDMNGKNPVAVDPDLLCSLMAFLELGK